MVSPAAGVGPSGDRHLTFPKLMEYTMFDIDLISLGLGAAVGVFFKTPTVAVGRFLRDQVVRLFNYFRN